MICLSFPLAKRLRLYQWGRNEFSVDTHSVWALSEHAFKWTLSTSASHYTRISKLSRLSSTTSNTITTAILALLHPPLPFLPLSLSHFPLWHFFFLVHITKDSFHLLFMKDSSTCFNALYVISEFVASLNQTTKSCKPSFLTTLSPFFPSLSWVWTSRWEAASWWSEHQSCQSAPRLVHHSQGKVYPYETSFLHVHWCLKHGTSATGIITMKRHHSCWVCPFTSSN